MSTWRKTTKMFAKHFMLLGFVAFPMYLNLIIHDHKAGFFCNDHSLLYPYKESTVSSEVVTVLSVTLPTIVFGFVEYYNKKDLRIEIKLWLKITYNLFFTYYFGIIATCSVMWLPKFFDGGLRPHFIDTCKPIMNDGTTCDDPINQNRFVEDYKCSTPDVPHNLYRTFPSGHATISCYTMVYLVMYLHYKLRDPTLQMIRTCIQWLFLSVAIYISLSRIYDHHHHVIDVVFGVILGTISAILVLEFVSNIANFKVIKTNHSYSTNQMEQELRSQDTLPQERNGTV